MRIPRRERHGLPWCLLASGIALAVTFSPLHSFAQEEAAGPAGGPVEASEPALSPIGPPPGIEAIEVTGERLDATNVQDEAQAITAFDTSELDRLQIGNVDGLSLNVPGLHVGQQGQNAIITLRGVGTENASLTGEPGVAFHVDGIYFGSPAAARTAFFDVQSIEVQRGPQGLLGGKNSTSGAIQVRSNEPTDEYEAKGDWLFGNYDRQRGRGMVNVPMGEYLAARVAVFYEDRDGYLDRESIRYAHGPNGDPDRANPIYRDVADSRDPFDVDNFGLRTMLRFAPADTLRLVVGYHFFEEQGAGPQADFVPLERERCTSNPLIPPGTTTRMGLVAGCLIQQYDPDPTDQRAGTPVFYPVTEDHDPRKTYSDFGSAQDDRYWGFSSRLEWDTPALPWLGETQLKLLGGFQQNEIDFRWDFDATDLEMSNVFADSEVREHTAELQWSGGERLSWQTSLFFQRQEGEARTMTPLAEAFPNPDQAQLPDLSSPTTYWTTVSYDTEMWTQNKSYGAALHGAYQISDNLSFSLGGRWIKDHKQEFLAKRSILELGNDKFEACRPNPSGREFGMGGGRGLTPSDWSQRLPSSCGLTFRGTSWGSRLEWRPADPYLLYAGIDRGYKSGGFASGGLGTYKPEKIWAYSAGAKTEFFDQRLQLNLEGFVYQYTDLQLALIDGFRIRTENTDARMYGWELEMRAQPIEGLSVQGLVAYLHTETIDYYTIDPSPLGYVRNPSEIGLPDYMTSEQVLQVHWNRLNSRSRADRLNRPWPGNEFCLSSPRIRCRNLGSSERGDGLDDYSDNQLPRSPELKWNIGAEYEIPLGRYGSLTPGVQYAWQDEAFYRAFNQDFDMQDSFHTTNLRLAWSSPEQAWEAEIFVNNVEDEAVKQNILIGPRGFGSAPLAWYSEPRFYGVRVGFKY